MKDRSDSFNSGAFLVLVAVIFAAFLVPCLILIPMLLNSPKREKPG